MCILKGWLLCNKNVIEANICLFIFIMFEVFFVTLQYIGGIVCLGERLFVNLLFIRDLV